MEDVAGLKRRFGDLGAAFAAIDAAVAAEIADGPTVPEVEWQAIAAGTVSRDLPALIRRRGCLVVHGVFPATQAAAWDDDITRYLADNDAAARVRAARPERRGTAPPQIWPIYWSPAQVAARQAPALAALRAWLNRLWRSGDAFDPDHECTYADRLRRRVPGDTSLALGPHIDGGTLGRWCDPVQRSPYRAVFAGDPLAFDPFDATGRTAPGAADANACAMFRTWQGWTALTAQGPGDGTLQVVPIARAIAWLLLRPFQPDVPPGSLCGAEAARFLHLSADWHARLLQALRPIPPVGPGDTVWWHPDLIHAVEARHDGTRPSNVMYIAAAPDCPRNRAFLAPQAAAFTAGRSPPDFPPDHLETDFARRAGPAALSALGRRQMGLD